MKAHFINNGFSPFSTKPVAQITPFDGWELSREGIVLRGTEDKIYVPLTTELRSELLGPPSERHCPNNGREPSEDGSYRYFRKWHSLSETDITGTACDVCRETWPWDGIRHPEVIKNSYPSRGSVEMVSWNTKEGAIDLDRGEEDGHALVLYRSRWWTSISGIMQRFPSAQILERTAGLFILRVRASEILE